MSVKLETDLAPCGRSDDFYLALDYSAVEKTLRKVVAARAWKDLGEIRKGAALALRERYPAVARVELWNSQLIPRLTKCGNQVFAHVGVSARERRAPQLIILDISLEGKLGYGDFSLAVSTARRAALYKPRKLLEALAEDAAGAVLHSIPGVSRITILARKRPAAMPGTSEVAVQIARGRP